MKVKIYTLEEVYNILDKSNVLSEVVMDDSSLKYKMKILTFDSREVGENTVFVCKGEHFKQEYLENAIKSGAIAYVSEKKYSVDLPCFIVKDMRETMGILANAFYGRPWKKLKTFGVTGTKGKSTTVYFLKQIINDYMKSIGENNCAYLSSIYNYDGVIEEESHLTTPEAMVLQKHFFNAVNSNIEYFLMEVSSQALKYDRTYGIKFDIGCFLNIGLDHISDIEHSDFDDYFNSKLKLLTQCKTIILNNEMEHFDVVMDCTRKNKLKPIVFGMNSDCDLYCYNVKSSEDGISFKVRTKDFDTKFSTRLHGLFNIENALAAIAAAMLYEIPIKHIKSGLKKATVDGRMEIFKDAKSGINVVVDYAHNKMSFKSLFESVIKEFPDKKITIVFGCPGRKAIGRRKELGELAGMYADMVYITEEDAGEEPIDEINKQIAKYVASKKAKYTIINDRREAIKEAIESADENTIVLITGKGRETRQKRGNKYIETASDVDCVCEFLNIGAKQSSKKPVMKKTSQVRIKK